MRVSEKSKRLIKRLGLGKQRKIWNGMEKDGVGQELDCWASYLAGS
jgi:hypothetical protein